MSTLAETYRGHAARATAEAEATTLENVRERNLRAARAWFEMADRQDRTERARLVREGKLTLHDSK
ncbi:hypothetical protein [Sphingomonas sp.]|uniref:hypothetical protein n=1 Tax=Sphingomonas sp. TaxID=28214 RepID=UPI001E05316A|nr:hypothetical protein [Sphingomonas sp.]MBX9795438.1 hypothetical protein [Sphingomonas sp.]